MFTGYFRDAETSLDYAKNRYHQPGMGRFMSPDPYRGSAKPNNPKTWNRYAYTNGDPINFVDRNGLYSCDPDDCGDDSGDGSSGVDCNAYPETDGCAVTLSEAQASNPYSSCYGNSYVASGMVNCSSSDDSSSEVDVETCEATLLTRPINYFPVGQLGGTHSYWEVTEVDESTGSTFDEIISAGPWTVNGKKYLDVWQHSSSNNATYTGPDTVANATSSWSTGFSTSNCAGVTGMVTAATSWPQNFVPYNNYSVNPINSNTFAWALGVIGGFNPPAPSGSWGWP
jgi:RHS repeat-associated protein